MIKYHLNVSKIGIIFLVILIIPNITVNSNQTPTKQLSNQLNSTQETTNINVLVVLMEIPNDPHHPSHTTDYYETLFFSMSGSLSVAEYFMNTSYGVVQLSGIVLGWYEAENELEFYGAGNRIPPGADTQTQLLADEARLNAQNSSFDPVNFDLFIVIHSGDGQEYSGNSDDIWSHASSFWYQDNEGWKLLEYTMNHEFVDYETPSHELGHALKFPDLYDLYYEHDFAGPYAMMDGGPGHFSIWNKYYSHVSRGDSPQLLAQEHRYQIQNYSDDTFITINPIALEQPSGIMWLEIGWDSTGFTDPNYGRGWTISVREDLDYDRFLPKHGVVLARIQVGPRSTYQTQVTADVYPPWDVIDSHPETSENKDDAAFSLTDGDIVSYKSGNGWAMQIIEKYSNSSYLIQITNETNIPTVRIIDNNQTISGIFPLKAIVNSFINKSIDFAEISIDNGGWKPMEKIHDEEGNFTFNWDTTNEREGSHLIRVRAGDSSTIPYIGHSEFIVIEVNNSKGTILIIDDDLGRSAEEPVLNALDQLGYNGDYEIIETTSFSEAEVSAEELSKYDIIFWIGNPSISPLSNSHINTAEFNEIRKYTLQATLENPAQIIFMSSYNIFDLSNQNEVNSQQVSEIFKATSPQNFRAPVTLLQGSHFLENLPKFTLGDTSTLRSNRSCDGEVVDLLSGAIPILKDIDPEYNGYDTKGYIVQQGFVKLVNYLFQPEMVPNEIFADLIDKTLDFLISGENIVTQTTTTRTTTSILDLGDLLLPAGIVIAIVGGIGTVVYMRRGIRKESKVSSYWLKSEKN